jgi:hypothetical protein
MIKNNTYKISVPYCKNKKTAYGTSKQSAITNYYNSNFKILKTAGITRTELRLSNI